MLILNLPYPCSVNHYYMWRAVKGRPMCTVGKQGRAYRNTITKLVQPVLTGNDSYFPRTTKIKLDNEKEVELSNRLVLCGEILNPDFRRRDIDNLNKCLLDALTHAGVFEDDSQIDDIHWFRDKRKVVSGGGLILKIDVIPTDEDELDDYYNDLRVSMGLSNITEPQTFVVRSTDGEVHGQQLGVYAHHKKIWGNT